jgi:hypothetical protein
MFSFGSVLFKTEKGTENDNSMRKISNEKKNAKLRDKVKIELEDNKGKRDIKLPQ